MKNLKYLLISVVLLGSCNNTFVNFNDQAIQKMIVKDDSDGLTLSLNKGLDVNYQLSGIPLLVLAASQPICSSNSVELLIDSGANLYKKESLSNKTALYYTVVLGSAECFHILLTPDVKQQLSQKELSDLVAQAVLHKDIDMLESLYAIGLSIDNMDTNGLTPLMWAASANNISAVEFLILNGADICKRNKRNQTAFDIAQKNNYFVIKQALTGCE